MQGVEQPAPHRSKHSKALARQHSFPQGKAGLGKQEHPPQPGGIRSRPCSSICLPFPKDCRAGSLNSMFPCFALEALTEARTKERAQEHPQHSQIHLHSFPHPQLKQREFSSEMPQKPARLGAAEGEKRHQRRKINTKLAISFAPDRTKPGGTSSSAFNQELS